MSAILLGEPIDDVKLARRRLWDLLAKQPGTEQEFLVRQALLSELRDEPQFRELRFTIDHELKRMWEQYRDRGNAIEAAQGLEDYDFDALPAMDAASSKDQEEMWS